MTDWKADFLTPKFVVALVAVMIFAWAYGANVGDETMKGAIIGGFNLALGFYLGSTSGASRATDNTQAAFRAIEATAKAGTPIDPKPDVLLKPGETAQAEES